VNEVTKTLFSMASTPQQMALLDPADVLEVIRPVGLAPKKSQFVVALSQKLVADFGANIPNTYAELESLPGVGHKTASVVMSQVFGVPSFAVDTHVHRLALRWV
ncbi:DNA glycosylase, partial [Ochromonadaceae sp. CCMP2298]